MLLSISLFSLPYFLYINCQENLVVKTEYGSVEGTKNQTIGQKKTYYAFRGIPYAQPPVGNLRFEPPKAPKPWRDTLKAFEDKSPCPQKFPVFGSEDCLYINVYTPKLPNGNSSLLPVMFFIHGGAFLFNDASYKSLGPDYLLEQNVVVVTFQYRLGILGFLSTNDLVVPGNNGLKDQTFALKWAKRNIAQFGGNPDHVTIFGVSAGSASVSLHTQSPLSKGLFKGAIMHSGTSLCPWSLTRLAREVAFATGKNLFIFTDDSKKLVDGLKKVDYRLLITASDVLIAAVLVAHLTNYGFAYGPVIEPEHPGAFFTSKSHELLRTGKFEKVPMIIGYNTREIGLFLPPQLMVPAQLYLTRFDFKPSDLVQPDMNIKDEKIKRTVGLQIKNHYWGNSPILFNGSSTQQFLDDDLFIRPTHETMRLQSQFTKIYCYRFSYEGLLGGVDHTKNPGVNHAEEQSYIWRVNNANSDASENDARTRERFVKLLTDFAKTGNPTPSSDPLFNGLLWPVYHTQGNQNVSCLDLGTQPHIVKDPDFNGVRFYRKLYAQYGHPPYDTY